MDMHTPAFDLLAAARQLGTIAPDLDDVRDIWRALLNQRARAGLPGRRLLEEYYAGRRSTAQLQAEKKEES